jgi:hypothetical protein
MFSAIDSKTALQLQQVAQDVVNKFFGRKWDALIAINTIAY